jgi:hypothetical protein
MSFFHSPVSFGDIWRGVNHGTMHGALFGGIDGRYNANFQSRSTTRGKCGVHINLDHESMERILVRVIEFSKAQCNNKQHMSIRFSTKIIIWLW